MVPANMRDRIWEFLMLVEGLIPSLGGEEAQAYAWNARRPLNSHLCDRPGGTDIKHSCRPRVPMEGIHFKDDFLNDC
jgi:hypothetical protein